MRDGRGNIVSVDRSKLVTIEQRKAGGNWKNGKVPLRGLTSKQLNTPKTMAVTQPIQYLMDVIHVR